MKVRDVMTSDIAIASPDTTLEEIATMMKTENTGAIPILEDDELLGIITDRDIVIRCIAEGEDPAELTADDILSESPEIVKPDTDAEDALEIMGRRQVRRLPVVEEGRLVGMVSLGDIAVKRGDLKDTGETLKDVSQGVKPSRRAAPQAQPARAVKSPKGKGSTGITNDVDEEERRQARVVSIRPDSNAPPRGGKKSGKREAS